MAIVAQIGLGVAGAGFAAIAGIIAMFFVVVTVVLPDVGSFYIKVRKPS